ncbi:hypothetical protein GYA28_01275 [Candidatus Roizmanbacteria bacterium]|nr:hypothetical protein [Candidatus Roizmanbacteria bacterium]
MADEEFIRIAGFNIQLIFCRTNFSFFKRRVRQEINEYVKGFISLKKPKKIHYRVKFVENKKTTIFDKSGQVFIHFYGKKENSLTTHYYINDFLFNFILRNILYILLKNEGIILHCSAVKIKKSAVLFLGNSSAGKSTIVSLLKGKYPPLADDLGILKREDGKYYFYQTPFLEKNMNFEKNSEKTIVKEVYFIKKAESIRARRITGRDQILEKLLPQVLFENKSNHLPSLKFLMDFGSSFPDFFTLNFPKNTEALTEFFMS